MILLDGDKYACDLCIRGHRASTCNHTDRRLTKLRPKGRPSTNCSHCKEIRRISNVNPSGSCSCGKSKKSKPGDKNKIEKDSAIDCGCMSGNPCKCHTNRKDRSTNKRSTTNSPLANNEAVENDDENGRKEEPSQSLIPVLDEILNKEVGDLAVPPELQTTNEITKNEPDLNIHDYPNGRCLSNIQDNDILSPIDEFIADSNLPNTIDPAFLDTGTDGLQLPSLSQPTLAPSTHGSLGVLLDDFYITEPISEFLQDSSKDSNSVFPVHTEKKGFSEKNSNDNHYQRMANPNIMKE
ncbi:Cup2p NDAI_0K02530 [Naumovozyma dairenensis CBS 421]|uniref:Copper-fist domain-containing protein n=1 Tax=Naumovozyma dairenensis (strain ATCC 10597 / BCRC 20456 / CBS 421 / NBRC 0211 / NRRL Y-12639) TaxID=1071378 RepID=G0WI33_NAUDC|nr:hypothetical protein NDAI_0K02530 [Naumovozyma dairenensis CBS 421]CCD27444.1 hypothetical protein NDAI_0K02530 [Naumovozyma dairenensis CBS 421]